MTLWAPITDEMIQIQWYGIHGPSLLVFKWLSVLFLGTLWQMGKAWTTWNSSPSICGLLQPCFGKGCDICVTTLLTSTQENFHGMTSVKPPIKSGCSLSKITVIFNILSWNHLFLSYSLEYEFHENRDFHMYLKSLLSSAVPVTEIKYTHIY